MSVLAITSLTTAKGQTVNTLSDTGNVGLGTTTPATKLEVVGNTKLGGRLEIDSSVVVKDSVVINKKLTVDQDVKIKGESVFDGNGKFKSDLRVLGTAQMKEKLVVDSTANFKSKIVVDGLGRFNGDIKLTGDFIFGNNKRISYLPASGGNFEIIGFGGQPLPPSIDPCFAPTVTTNQFSGMIQTHGASAYGGMVNILSMGFDGANGIIDMAGTNNQGGPALLINYYCGKDIFMNTGSNGGNVQLASTGNVGVGKTPNYKLDVGGNMSINSNKLFFKDENHGLGYFQEYADKVIDGPVLFGWSGGALAIKHIDETKNILTWNENGSVKIYTNNGVPEIKSLSITDETSNVDVFRVMSNGNVFATELTIKLKEDFPDYVFEKNYQLLSLSELEHFITKNKHLPNIPNAKEVEKNGLNVSEIQIKQMQKIEELTLYILELNKRIEILNSEYSELKKMMIKH